MGGGVVGRSEVVLVDDRSSEDAFEKIEIVAGDFVVGHIKDKAGPRKIVGEHVRLDAENRSSVPEGQIEELVTHLGQFKIRDIFREIEEGAREGKRGLFLQRPEVEFGIVGRRRNDIRRS